MNTYFEQCLRDLEEDFGFPYEGEISQACKCEDCSDNLLAEIRDEMKIEYKRQADEMNRMKSLYDAEVKYGIHKPRPEF